MSNNPDEIRADIERTQSDLGRDVDALAEKVSPTKAVSRQTDRLRDGVGRRTDRARERLTHARESVMGTPDYGPRGSGGQGGLHEARDKAGDLAHDARDRAGNLAHEAGDRVSHLADEASQAVQQAPAQVRRQTRGNPLAAGLIALGAGWLIGSLIPTSRAEQDAATSLKDHAGPVVEEAKSAAQDMQENLKPQAQEAAESVKDSAASGAENVKSEGQDQAQEVKGDSKRAAQHVKDDAQKS